MYVCVVCVCVCVSGVGVRSKGEAIELWKLL